MSEIRLLIVDDHKVVREGIKHMLAAQTRLVVDVDEAEEVDNAIYKAGLLDYDVILMDINMGTSSGIDATKAILQKRPEMKVLALSMHNEEHKIKQMLGAGALGYVLKNTEPDELVRAIETVNKGQKYFSNEVALTLMGMPQIEKKVDIPLTKREIQILKLIAEEFTNEEIAGKLHLSKRTIDAHRQKMLTKLELRNTAGLIRYAMRNGILD